MDFRPANPGRRNFLIRCCQGAGAALVPAGLRGFAFPSAHALDSTTALSSDPQFHLHPRYRTHRPLDATLLKVNAGLDDFVTEKYHDQIAAILAEWSSSLRESPLDTRAIEKVLSSDFLGSSWRPVESRVVRSGPPVEVRVNNFTHQTALRRDGFLQEWRAAMSSFSKIITAAFEITSIDISRDASAAPTATEELHGHDRVGTRVRYEFVGTGKDFYREQRAGYWELEWEASSSGEFRLREWQALDETQSRAASPVFVDITSQALGGNSSYSSQLLHGADYWRTVLDGACGIDIYGHNGVSIGDVDGDGFDDLYICQPAGLPNRLYHNRGNGTFEDITERSGVGILENTACALFADVDNDGRQDLIVVRTNGPLLFLNEGGGKFRQRRDAFQFAKPPQGTFTGAAMADYDRDGWLDIYFCLYIYYQGADQYKYPTPYYDAENGPPNFLMRNNRDGSFRDVTAESGLDRNNIRYSFCCEWNDYDRDGWPDLYVVNDFGRKNLYRNNGDGTFTDVAAQAGVEDVGAGMSVCWLDYDNDGAEDLYVADMWTAAGMRISTQEIFQKNAPEKVQTLYRKHARGNSLFRNGGNGSFNDITAPSGAAMGRWSWSSDAWDFDHDGFPDLYIANGMVSGPSLEDLNSFFWRQVVAKSPVAAKPSHDYEQGWNAINELIRSDGTWSGFERNVFYANNRDGTFSDVSGALSLDFVEDGRAFALSDFDHDGRLEVFLKNRNAPQLRILKNAMETLPASIAFRLRGTKSNRDAIGAVVTVESEAGRQTRSLQAGSGFLSQHTKEIFFGIGQAKGPVRVSIRWPSGLVQEIREIPVNQRVWVEEGSPPSRIEPLRLQGLKPLSFATPNGTAEAVPSRKSAPNEAVLSRESASDGAAQAVPSRKSAPGGTVEAVPSRPSPSASSPARNGLEQQAESLPTSAETWLLAPVSAPDFSLSDANGRTLSLSALRGGPVLLNFWAMQSASCKEDLQTINHLHKRWGGGAFGSQAGEGARPTHPARPTHARPTQAARPTAAGLRVLAVNVDNDADVEKVRAMVREQRLSFPVLLGSDDVAGVYNIVYRYLFDRHRDLSLPTSFLIDDKGEIVKVYQGPVNPEHVERDFRQIPQTTTERLAKALPFPGVSEGSEVRRNYLSYGSVFYQRGYFDQAEASFRLALRDDPSAEALYGLGSACLEQGKNAEARESFERAVKLQASYPDTLPNAWNNLGLLATREGRTADAIPYFQEALRVNPEHVIALVNLGNAYRQQKQWEQARVPLQRAVEVSPDDPEANYSLGMVFAQVNDTDHAYEYLQRALKARPDYPEALNNLGILYLRTGRRDEAVASFEQCIRVAPGFDQAYLNLARVYAVEGAREKARAVLLGLLKQHPGHVQGEKMLGELGR